jgi:hypothetical protein
MIGGQMNALAARKRTWWVGLFALCVISAFACLAALVTLDAGYRHQHPPAHDLPDVLMAAAFALVGLVLIAKRPENLVGWALSLAGLGLFVGGVLSAYAALALLAKPEWGLPGGTVAGALAVGSWAPLMCGVFLLFLGFPGGDFPSARWRRVASLVLVGFALIWLGIDLSPGTLDPPLEHYRNPIAVTHSGLFVPALFAIIAPCLVCLALAGADLVRRFRRSRGVERQQFKWLATTATLLVITMPFSAAFNWADIPGAIFSVLLIALPVSVGIAVLRYRLYDIDVIIRRTLVYGVLTGLLAASYLGAVLGLQQVFSSIAGGSNLAIVASTLGVAAIARPLRRRVQSFVDRRFYRRKYDAERTLSAFSARLRDQVDLDALRADLTGVMAETMQPAHLSFWLREQH